MLKRWSVLALCLIMLFSFASLSVAEESVLDPYTPMPETFTFTKGIRTPAGNLGLPDGDNLVNNDYTRYVEEQVNVKVELAWEAADNDYDQKLGLSIAAGDIPDMLMVKRSIFEQLVENDLIWDLTEYYEKCVSDEIKAMIDSYGPRLMAEVTVDGKMMAIPGTQIGGQWSVLWIRKDWLDKLNLEVPKTMDDVIAVAKAFVDANLDESGLGKTIGLPIVDNVVEGYNGQYGTSTIFSVFGAWPKRWIEREGKVVYGSTLPEMKEALTVLRDMYAAGLIDKEFAVRKGADRNAMLITGQAGMAFLPWYGGAFIADSVKNNPEAEWIVVSAPENADGKISVFTQDPVSTFLVISKKCEHPEAVIKALNVGYDVTSGRTERGAEMYAKILENNPALNWTVVSVPITFDFDNALEIGYEKMMTAIANGSAEGMTSDVKQWYASYVADKANPKANPGQWREALMRTTGVEAAVIDEFNLETLVFYGTTETMALKWSNLEKLELEMMLQIIMGEKPVDEFDNFVKTWKAMGGDEITAEVQEAVDAKK